MRATILSGKVMSGKTWIANAIKMTHPDERVIEINAEYLLNLINDEEVVFRNLSDHYDLIIVEECSKREIISIEECKEQVLFKSEKNWPEVRSVWSTVKEIPMVYLTQNEVTKQDFPIDKFHVINCNNRII